MLFLRSKRLPLGVRLYNRNMMHGMPTMPKMINVPIIFLYLRLHCKYTEY